MEWFVHFGEQINNSGADALMAFNFAFSAAVLGVGDEMIFDRDAITQPAWRAGGNAVPGRPQCRRAARTPDGAVGTE